MNKIHFYLGLDHLDPHLSETRESGLKFVFKSVVMILAKFKIIFDIALFPN